MRGDEEASDLVNHNQFVPSALLTNRMSTLFVLQSKYPRILRLEFHLRSP